jgi:hypothetical protein
VNHILDDFPPAYRLFKDGKDTEHVVTAELARHLARESNHAIDLVECRLCCQININTVIGFRYLTMAEFTKFSEAGMRKRIYFNSIQKMFEELGAEEDETEEEY